jgi:ABC-type bacteriocin/lantibiotic exporter with double-glycine peptidase domain
VTAPAPERTGLRRSLADLWRLARLFRSEWPTVGRAGALAAGAAALGLTIPLLTKALFDAVYPAGNVSLLGLVVAGLLAATAGQGAVTALGRFTAFVARVRMRDVARLALFNHVLHLPARTLERRRSGEIAQRFGDVKEVLDTGADAALTVMAQGLFLVAVPPLLVALDARLAAVALVAVPVTAATTGALGALANRHWQRTLAAYDDWAALQVEAVREARTFKAMACEAALYRRARRVMAVAHDGAVRATGLWYLCTGTNAVVRALNLAALTYVGWRLVLGGSVTLGTYVAFQAYAALLLGPLASLIDAGGKLQKAAVSLARVADLADEPLEADPAATFRGSTAPDESPLALTGQLRVRGLRFRYDADGGGLDLAALDLAPGETVAVVGRSGCGKSTLLRLLVGTERPDTGVVEAEVETAHGTAWWDVRSFDSRAWRSRLAACWQEPGLLSSSVRDNVLLACEDTAARPVSDAEVVAALQTCALGPRLDALAVRSADGTGLDVTLTEGGGALSAGERQRLALARTIVRVRTAAPGRPIRLVVLDEATANLDGPTASAVLGCVLDHLRAPVDRPPPAVVLVTHREADAALADRVVRLDATHHRRRSP